jgi:ATP-binding protein involved in chromosome partitioning
MAKQPQFQPKKADIDAKFIIAVASGKGGVGKSTVAVNLALSLADSGKQTGLLDADIYGPNIPLMLGLEKASARVLDSKLIPVEAYGLKVMSVGFITQQERALIWRGPLANRLIEQFLTDVQWGKLDILVIDLPPGTGDVPLSIIQKCALSGGIVVTTPQEASVADVKKMLDMFKTTKTKILGIVENMKYLVCPDCTKKVDLYPNGSSKSIPELLKERQLAEFPFVPQIGLKQGGKPYFFSAEDSSLVQQYRELSKKVLKLL